MRFSLDTSVEVRACGIITKLGNAQLAGLGCFHIVIQTSQISSTPCWTYLKYPQHPVEGYANLDKAGYKSDENGARRVSGAAPHFHELCVKPRQALHILRKGSVEI